MLVHALKFADENNLGKITIQFFMSLSFSSVLEKGQFFVFVFVVSGTFESSSRLSCLESLSWGGVRMQAQGG